VVTTSLGTYPSVCELHGSTFTIRLMARSDRDAMLAFAHSMPEHDLLFLRRDITRPEEVDGWIGEIESGINITILAVGGSEIVGYAAVALSPLKWTRHVGEIRVSVASSVRGIGMGRLLTNEAFHLAVDHGVEKMVAQMTPDQETAIAVFHRMGFQTEARLLDQVQDRNGNKHDLLVLSHDVSIYQAALKQRGQS
jgi:L-amino acid N-acyltransferase YncA